MKLLTLLYSIILLGFSLAENDEENSEPLPPPLTAENFEETLKTGLHIVEFFSPYCSHCKQLAPIWKDTWNAFHKEGESLNITFSQVDCIASGDLCSKEEITSYPTIKLYSKNGFIKDYPDEHGYERTKEDFIKFARESVFENPDFDVLQLEGDSEYITNLEMISLLSGLEDLPYLVSFWPTHKLKKMTDEVEYKYCKDCEPFQETWMKITKELLPKGILTAHFNCEEYPKICSEIGFPELAEVPEIPAGRGPRIALFLPDKDHNNLFVYRKKFTHVVEDYVDFAIRTYKNSMLPTFSPSRIFEIISKDNKLEHNGATNNKVHVVFAYNKETVVDEDFHILEYLIEPLSLIPNLYLYKTEDDLMFASREGFRAFYNNLETDMEGNKIEPNEEYFMMASMTQYPTFYLFREGDRIPHVYHGYSSTEMRDYNQIMHWVYGNSYPYVEEIDYRRFEEKMNFRNDEYSYMLLQFVDMSNDEKLRESSENLNNLVKASLNHEAKRIEAIMKEIDRKRDKKVHLVQKLKDQNAEIKKINAVRNSEITHENNKKTLITYIDLSKHDYFTINTGLDRTNHQFEIGDVVILDKKRRKYYTLDITGEQLTSKNKDMVEKTLTALNLPKMTEFKLLDKGHYLKSNVNYDINYFLSIPHIHWYIACVAFVVITVYFKNKSTVVKRYSRGRYSNLNQAPPSPRKGEFQD
ncbi:hypothetical protein TBLA_0A01010 [Henningerozyma blattae CBS 6284]|uniref:Thioredoxin domain-containing protein n=1 Tax=Henningerozyma blattae (strain ATCC 34711 / CBS 6284 / DSM 70876 / NBRC 10599 / NRRL Y-10934 / UCD 77-7) TaxID=1071380 RepID=I2GUU9_HENB6|nr:hypothetical protein TBLA_0A01010 [Tetrapisispora blattae CBS 6284]CCH57901.1 hypothetical protein TBLA_0A01010 [Tetrapisispora blattae CBS 6284]